MSVKISVVCDRCGETVIGHVFPSQGDIPGRSSGFYLVGKNHGWHKYARPGEEIICDACMWKDPKYLADYPGIPPSDVAVAQQPQSTILTALNQAFDWAEQETSEHFKGQTCSMNNSLGQQECPICYFRQRVKMHLVDCGVLDRP